MLLDRVPVRFRLSLGHAFWMALVFLGVGIGLYRVVEHNLYQSIDAALVTSAKSIRDTRFVRGFGPPLMERFLSQFFGERYLRLYAQLVDLSGNISIKTDRMVNLPVTPKALSNAERGMHTLETFRREEVPIRLITLPVTKYGRFTGELIQVAAPLDSTHNTLRGIAWVLWVALPTSLVLSSFFGYLLTARALKPVQNISLAAANMSSDDLSVRLAIPRANDELQKLTLTFNDLLSRLEDAFMRLRRFTGDVSHELRTPLAVLRGEAELALRRDRSADEYKSALRTIVNESQHMTSIVEDLLLLARAESRSVAMHWEKLSVDAFLRDLQTSVAKVFEAKNVTLKIANNVIGEFDAAGNLLSLALKNILLNAVKHSAAADTVSLSVRSIDGVKIEFAIVDQGEGIPAESLPYIFDPFYRADTARNRAAGGAGIGLSLAQALVKLHGGMIRVESTQGVGSKFMVTVPRERVTVCDSNGLPLREKSFKRTKRILAELPGAATGSSRTVASGGRSKPLQAQLGSGEPTGSPALASTTLS